MAFIVFAMAITGGLFRRTVNNAIEYSKDKAVQMAGEGKA
jgi:hypothetical protein